MSLAGIRGFVYALFGTFVLSTLWVTSLTILSAQPAATALITAAGADILNPFLTRQGLGLTQGTYVSLEANARAHPSQALALPLLKVQVRGAEIVGQPYAAVVHIVYADVADTYYSSGPGAVFDVPPQLQQVLPNFGLFNPDNIPLVQGGPTAAQLPAFMQPFFVFTGLTPNTFTQAGHQRLFGFLPWFWLATGVLVVVAIALNPSEKKLAGLAEGVVHSTWPVVAILLALWIGAQLYPATFAPYAAALGIVRGAFLPVYGLALLVGLVGVALITLVPALRKREQNATGASPLATGEAPSATMNAELSALLGSREVPAAPPASGAQP